ncbi:MAG: AraC family transcriptional regulator [Prevotella sp.]|nr:AraC family transcriptional regulator [Prevotella sp.]
MKPDKQIGLHRRNSWELSYVVKGRGERIIGGETTNFEEGDFVLVAPNMDHGWFFNPSFTDEEGNIESITLMWTTELMIQLSAIFPDWKDVVVRFQSQKQSLQFDSSQNEKLIKALYALVREKDGNPGSRLMEVIVMVANSLHSNAERIGNVQLTQAESRLQEITVYTCCNYARQITVDEIAKHVGMNRSAFCTFFRKQTGKTYINFLNEYRLKVAHHLLTNTNNSISAVCWQCGFNDLAYFDKLFKKAFNTAPSDIKRRKI